MNLTATAVAPFILLFHFKVPDMTKDRLILITFEVMLLYDLRLTWCFGKLKASQKEGGESEYGIRRVACDSLSQKATIFIHHALSSLST